MNLAILKKMRSIRKLSHVWVLLGIVLVLAAIFRLPLLQYAEFKGDEALTLFLATRPLFGHPFPPAGLTSSAGILNFPLINYLLLPVVLFTLYPPSISFVIALLNVAAIGGFFLLFSKYHGRLTGFLASCIIALSPWMILYSRKIWEQDFLIPLSLPFFLSMYKILEGKKSYWLLFGITSMLLLQVHQLAIIVPFFIFLSFLFEKHVPDWRKLITGILIGLIPTIPYFLYAIQTHFSDFKPTNALGARFVFHDASTFLRPLQILSIGDFHTELGNDFAVFAAKFHFIYEVSMLSYLAYLLLPAGLVLFAIKNKKYRFFTTVLLLNLVLFFIIGIEPLMHYFILLVPFIAVIDAFLLAALIRSKKLYFAGIAITAAYMVSLFLFNYGFLWLLAKQHGFAGDYGSGYAESEKGAKVALRDFANSRNYQELNIYYFLPLEYFHGYMPIGKMIFPRSFLQQHEATVEKKFMQQSNNPELALEVFAYYTQDQNPSWNYVTYLNEKSKQNHLYNFVYQQVLDEYLSSHLKRKYETPDFWLLYPQHWTQSTEENSTILSDGDSQIIITQFSTPNSNTLFLRAHYYTIDVKPGKGNEEKLYAQKVYGEVIESLRIFK